MTNSNLTETVNLEPTSKQQTQQFILIAFIVAACCIRVLLCLQHNPMDFLWSDPLRHWQNGKSLLHGGYASAADPIGYQVYIFLLRTVTGDSRILIALACALLSVIMPWTYYRAARSFGLRKTPALWIWALIAWAPSLFTIYHYIMMETLLLALDGAAIWATGRYLRKADARSFLVSIFWWTLACLTKPTVIPLAGIFVLWSCWKKRPSLGASGVAAVLVILMLLPQAVRSKFELGFVAPFGNPWLTKIQHRSGAKRAVIYFRSNRHPDETQRYWFSSPSCYIQPLAPFSSWRIRRAYVDSDVTIRASAENGARDWANTYAGLDTSREEWLAQWEENIVLFLFAPSWPESSSTLWDSQLALHTRWIWGPLIMVVLGWNASRFLKGRFDLLPVAITFFTLFLLLQNVATTEGRYRKPLEPLLLMNAVWLVATRSPRNPRNMESAA